MHGLAFMGTNHIRHNKELDFNGSGDSVYVSSANMPNFRDYSPISFVEDTSVYWSCWFKADTLPTGNSRFRFLRADAPNGAVLDLQYYANSGSPRIRVLYAFQNRTSGSNVMDFPTTLSTGTYYHILFIKINQSPYFEVYLNGTALSMNIVQWTSNGSSTARPSYETMHIGSFQGTTGYFNGKIIQFVVGFALTASEEAALPAWAYNSGSPLTFWEEDGNVHGYPNVAHGWYFGDQEGNNPGHIECRTNYPLGEIPLTIQGTPSVKRVSSEFPTAR